MATIEEALVAVLKGNGTVAGYVSARIYPSVAPQGATKPHIVYTAVSNAPEHTHDEVQDTFRPRVQFSCIGASYASAKTLAKAVVAALRYYNGTASGVQIDAILGQNEVDTFVMAADQSQSSYITTVDFLVWHH